MEWRAPAIVLDSRPLGEGGAVVTVFTEAQGRGLPPREALAEVVDWLTAETVGANPTRH